VGTWAACASLIIAVAASGAPTTVKAVNFVLELFISSSLSM
jgi:hypothetical protein